MSDGGPAFPRPAVNDKMGWLGAQQGMTLRDYFAAAALTGILASYANEQHVADSESCAKEAYERADSMLAERAKEQK